MKLTNPFIKTLACTFAAVGLALFSVGCDKAADDAGDAATDAADKAADAVGDAADKAADAAGDAADKAADAVKDAAKPE